MSTLCALPCAKMARDLKKRVPLTFKGPKKRVPLKAKLCLSNKGLLMKTGPHRNVDSMCPPVC